MATGIKHPRVTLQFNDYDFRHRKVLEILRARPRNMTDLVVNAIIHYMSCPDAGDDLTKQMVRKTVKEVIYEMLSDGSLAGFTSQPGIQPPSVDDSVALAGMMDAFR